MNRFCTLTTVLSSPNNGQLHDDLPGPEAVVLKPFAGGSARSVPSVDSAIVLRSPMTAKRQGVDQGNVDSGVTAPPLLVSSGPGKSMKYSVLRRAARSRDPQ